MKFINIYVLWILFSFLLEKCKSLGRKIKKRIKRVINPIGETQEGYDSHPYPETAPLRGLLDYTTIFSALNQIHLSNIAIAI